jgi:hypothetical protein
MKLGKTQLSFLRCVKEHGAYYRGGGWTWGGPAMSERLAEGLVKRGMLWREDVRRSLLPGGMPFDRTFYRITEAGLAYLATIAPENTKER